MVDNRQVVAILAEVADILEILGENPYKVMAYRRASYSIKDITESLEALWQEGKLLEIKGVGKAIKSQVEEILKTGQLEYHQELLRQVPRGVLKMLALPGVGPRTVRIIHKNLGITNLDDLLQAVKDHMIRELPGLGAKTEYNIKQGIEMLKSIGDIVTLGNVLPIAQDFCSFLTDAGVVVRAEVVGSIRRRKPVVHDIDILVATAHPEMVKEHIEKYKRLVRIEEVTSEVISGKIGVGYDFEVILVNPSDFPLAFLLATGSKEHRFELLKMLRKAEVTSGTSEEAIYQSLGMQWIPPELRENQGEIELALKHRLPSLISQQDLKGDLHVHTDWSDGVDQLEQMVKQAQLMGYSYLAITEHSKSLKICRGLDEERLQDQLRTIERINKELQNFKVLSGIEVDILRDGSLDFSDEILEQLDVVVASIHSHFHLSKAEQTHRIISAINNCHVDIIGHLTGRLLNRRFGYQVDFNKVLKAAALRGTVLEINAHPDRLDISEEVAFQAKAKGIKMVINSDAHRVSDLPLIGYGIFNARRGWLEAEDVINTWSLGDLLHYLENKFL